MADEIQDPQEKPAEHYAAEQTKDTALTKVTYHELVPSQTYHRDPGYRPWLRTSAPRKPTHYEELLAMMARNLNYAVLASKCTLVFAIILVSDLILPNTRHVVTITGYNVSTGGTIQMELDDNSVINISKKTMRKMKGKLLTISRTRIFDVPYKIQDKEKNAAGVEISIYGNFIFGPLALLATSLVGVLHRKGVEFRFNLGVASVVLAFLNIAFLHVHKF